MKNYKIAVLVPCYKRPEYTLECIKSIEKSQKYDNVTFFLCDDGSNDGTDRILLGADIPKAFMFNKENIGLRAVVINYIKLMQKSDFDIVGKIDNDSIVPKDFVNNIIKAFENSDCDIISPDNYPSRPAQNIGDKNNKTDYIIPSKIVGGLWFMKKHVINGIDFENHNVWGIKGAFNVLYQILQEKSPKVGWAYNVVIDDVGHWSGQHPKNIKSQEHEEYYHEVGRNIAW